MQKNIVWTGIAYHSLENCIVTWTDKGVEIQSSIIGTYNNSIYKVDYKIVTNKCWETISFDINWRLNDTTHAISFKSDAKGKWSGDGKPVEIFDDCIDVDIAVTPFTNTLPINRLQLSEKKEQQIRVIYIDILNQQVRPISQKYTRLSQHEYKYENVPSDFEAIIAVDESGLVVNYPGLFKRTAIKENNDR